MNNNSKIIIGIVVLAILGIGGYLFLNKSNYSSMTPTVAPTTAMEQPTAEPAMSPEASPAASGAMMKENSTMTKVMTVNLTAQNKSGQIGTATLKEVNGQTVVTVNLTGAPVSAEPDHIHIGSCPTPGSVKYPLNSVVNGKSETTINTTIDNLKKQLPLSINVHKSAADIATYVACGDLK